MRILSNNFYPFILSILLSNCSVPPAPSFPSNPAKDLTQGIFENQIRKGMSQAEILETLGAPNILTKNSLDEEVWTYDKEESQKNETERVNYGQRTLTKGFFTFLFGGKSSYVLSTTTNETKSLTIIITFNENKKVRDFGYQILK
tara:strand:+ start:1030 stop:1464 length:435 start_codon:yes stop_codon:yes gene_type:complete